MAVQIANILSHHLQTQNGTLRDPFAIFNKLKLCSAGNHAKKRAACANLDAKNLKLTSLAVQSLGELVNCRGNLQTLVED